MKINYKYIHHKKQNFLNMIDSGKFSVNYNSLNMRIQKEYIRMHKEAQNRTTIIKQNIPAANEIMSFIGSFNVADSFIENTIESDNGLDKKIRQMSIDAASLSSVLKKIDDANLAVDKLNIFLNGVSDIIEAFNEIDASIFDYYSSLEDGTLEKQSLKMSFGNNLQFLNINKTAFSSLNSLSNRIDGLKSIANINNYSGIKTNVTYTDSHGQNKVVPLNQVLFGMRQLIINILGGYGEAVTALRIIQETDKLISDLVEKGLSDSNATITVSGEGTTKLKSGKVSKSDITINYNENGVNLLVGISAKAQNHRGGKTVTTFQTSKLKEYLTNTVLKNVQYQFLNNLYHNRMSLNEQMIMNRYITAMNFDNAVTGINIGDNVMFLSYLDEIITVEEFYQDILNRKSDIKSLPYLSITGVKKALTETYGKNIDGWIDLSPDDKSVLAFQRSQQRRDILLSLQGQIKMKI